LKCPDFAVEADALVHTKELFCGQPSLLISHLTLAAPLYLPKGIYLSIS